MKYTFTHLILKTKLIQWIQLIQFSWIRLEIVILEFEGIHVTQYTHKMSN